MTLRNPYTNKHRLPVPDYSSKLIESRIHELECSKPSFLINENDNNDSFHRKQYSFHTNPHIDTKQQNKYEPWESPFITCKPYRPPPIALPDFKSQQGLSSWEKKKYRQMMNNLDDQGLIPIEEDDYNDFSIIRQTFNSYKNKNQSKKPPTITIPEKKDAKTKNYYNEDRDSPKFNNSYSQLKDEQKYNNYPKHEYYDSHDYDVSDYRKDRLPFTQSNAVSEEQYNERIYDTKKKNTSLIDQLKVLDHKEDEPMTLKMHPHVNQVNSTVYQYPPKKNIKRNIEEDINEIFKRKPSTKEVQVKMNECNKGLPRRINYRNAVFDLVNLE